MQETHSPDPPTPPAPSPQSPDWCSSSGPLNAGGLWGSMLTQQFHQSPGLKLQVFTSARTSLQNSSLYIYLSTQALCLNVYAITQPVRAPILTSPSSSRSPFTAIPSFKQLSSKALASSFSHTPHPTHGKILLATSTSDYVRTLTTFYHFHHFHACLSDHDLLPGLSSWSPDWSPCFWLHPSRGLFSIRSWNNLPK